MFGFVTLFLRNCPSSFERLSHTFSCDPLDFLFLTSRFSPPSVLCRFFEFLTIFSSFLDSSFAYDGFPSRLLVLLLRFLSNLRNDCRGFPLEILFCSLLTTVLLFSASLVK